MDNFDDENNYEEEEPMTEDMINKLLEDADKQDNEMTPESVVDCINRLDAKFQKNKELRKKFKGKPEGYADSEADLHEEIKILQRIAAYPNLAPTFLDNKGIDVLFKLLTHENTDIIADAIIVIDEITDADFLQEIENPKEFIELFISNDLFGLLVNTLLTLNEDVKDEYQIVSDILSVFENFIEVYPYSSQMLCETRLLNWLLKRIYKDDDMVTYGNKLFASEILNSLIQSSSESQVLFTKKDGLNLTLQLFTQMPEPKGEEEEEFIYNIVNTICSCLLLPENQSTFKQSDGIKSMLALMKDNTIFRHLAVKILNYATQNNYKNCKQLVELDGLKSVFSYFMGKGFKGKPKLESLFNSMEEHCLSILLSLCKYTKGIQAERLIYKFKENSYEKCNRLMTLFKKYEMTYEQEGNENDQEDEYVEKLNSGLFNLQTICTILGFLLTSGGDDVKKHLSDLATKNGVSVKRIKSVLEDFANHMGEEFVSDESFSNRNFINNLINSI
jgi:beta-catenin-like protein 1